MNEALKIDDLTFEVRRSKHRKTLGLTVNRDASLIVHLPEATSLDEASALIETRLVWIYQKLGDREATPGASVFRRPEFIDGEGFYVLGRHYRLKFIDPPPIDDEPTTAARIEGDRLILTRDAAGAAEQHLTEFYRREATRYLDRVVAQWHATFGYRNAIRIRVRDLGYRWGSCGKNGLLNFHWRVIQLPPSAIDYVVVHELAHLSVPDHSPAFWREVEKVLPDYRARRDWLREKGGTL